MCYVDEEQEVICPKSRGQSEKASTVIEGLLLERTDIGWRGVAWLVNSYARAASAGERMFEILDSKSEVVDKNISIVMPRPKGYVTLENVSFSYDGEREVIRNLNIEARPGEVIALLGGPGSGKTSVINLGCRLNIYEGEVINLLTHASGAQRIIIYS